MTTEAQVAMLMLRLLLDNPPELQNVLDYLREQVVIRKAALEIGRVAAVSRQEILAEFEEKYGLVIDFLDDEPEPGQVTTTLLVDEDEKRLVPLPGGAKFRL